MQRLVTKYQAQSKRERNALNEQETRLNYILTMFRALVWDTEDAAHMRAELQEQMDRTATNLVRSSRCPG